jgi:flagellar biosynthesis/type III secretory pathway protein FliH
MWDYRYTLIDMHNIDCTTLIRRDNPDALVLAILCDFKGNDPQEVVNFIVLRLSELLHDNPKRLREYLSVLSILSENRDLQPLIKEAGNMLTKVNVEKMPFYQLGMEKGIEKGIEKGMKKGMEKGMIEAMHENILEILTLRFEHVPEKCRSRIAAETDLQRLHALLRQAVKVDSAGQLFQ